MLKAVHKRAKLGNYFHLKTFVGLFKNSQRFHCCYFKRLSNFVSVLFQLSLHAKVYSPPSAFQVSLFLSRVGGWLCWLPRKNSKPWRISLGHSANEKHVWLPFRQRNPFGETRKHNFSNSSASQPCQLKLKQT